VAAQLAASQEKLSSMSEWEENTKKGKKTRWKYIMKKERNKKIRLFMQFLCLLSSEYQHFTCCS
jgi:hypothetical protein